MTFDSALKAVLRGESSPNNVLELFNSASTPQTALALLSAASSVRDEKLGREIKLHGHLGMITSCPLNPPCRYCSVASDDSEVLNGRKTMSIESILEGVRLMEERGMGVIHLVGGTCIGGLDAQVKEVVSAIRENTDVPLEIAVGPSLSLETVRWLKARNLFRIVCALETLSDTAFKEAKPGDSLEKRIAFMKMLERENVQLKTIVLNGIGSNEDLIRSILYMTRFKNLTSLAVSTFTPIAGTPWANRQPASVWDSIKAMAITRFLLPKGDVGLAFGGGGNLMPMILLAGGGNTFMPMMIDYAKQSDSITQINSYASALGFKVKPGVA